MPSEIEPRDLFADCAVVWTRNKVCTRRGWQHTQPLPADVHAERWASRIERGYEPALTLRTSGLIGFEADGDENAERLEMALDVVKVEPWVVEGRRADDGRRVHVYVRAPLDDVRATLDDPELPKVSFRFEAGTIVAASNNYFRCAYKGGPYHLQRANPLAPPMTDTAYGYFLTLARKAERQHRADLATGEPLAEGSRRNSVFRFACLLSRWTTDADLAAEMADVWQQTVCDPPIPFEWVAQQVRGAWVVAERDDRLGCEVPTPPTSAVMLHLLADGFAQSITPWCPDAKTALTLLSLWAAPLAEGAKS